MSSYHEEFLVGNKKLSGYFPLSQRGKKKEGDSFSPYDLTKIDLVFRAPQMLFQEGINFL